MTTTENNRINLAQDAAERIKIQQDQVIRDGVRKELAQWEADNQAIPEGKDKETLIDYLVDQAARELNKDSTVRLKYKGGSGNYK